MLTVKKHSRKLKVWSVEMPNTPYSNRYGQVLTRSEIREQGAEIAKMILSEIKKALKRN